MSTIAISHPSRVNLVRNYASNVGVATRALLAALLATGSYQPAESSTTINQAASQEISLRTRARNLSELSRMAAQYEDMAPNLSAELRFLALRN